jgi:hypothetical protein
MNKATNMGNGTVTTPIHELVNQEIKDLWNGCRKADDVDCRDLVSLHPLAVGPLEKGAILFIGLNPSFSERAWKGQDAIENPLEFYAHDGTDYCLKRDLAFEKTARENYSYFEQFRRIAECSKYKWEHIDLFFVRCTSQKELKAKLSKSSTRFVEMQLEQSKKLIIASDPLVIIVANAEASNRYRKLFEEELKASRFDDRGYHYTCINQKCIPTFFTSMLTGQRALDNGSRERLSWQISQALKNEQEPSGQS